MKRAFRFLLTALVLLAACAAPLQTQAPTGEPVLSYAFNSRAWDGTYLWQYIKEPGQERLHAYRLADRSSSEVSLKLASIPQHKSLAWGQDSLWLLDYANTLYRLSPRGALLHKVTATGLPSPDGLTQITWHGQELWALQRKFYDPAAGRGVPPTFYRLDPESGRVLDQFPIDDAEFARFLPLTLAAHQGHLYLANSHLFEEKHNLLFRISLTQRKLERFELGRVYSGISSLFVKDGALHLVELLDFANCGQVCRGRVEKLELSL